MMVWSVNAADVMFWFFFFLKSEGEDDTCTNNIFLHLSEPCTVSFVQLRTSFKKKKK